MPVSGVPPVHPGLALESMRNSSFDTFSALGELIDNSIEARATNIKIRLDQYDANAGKRGRAKIRTTMVAVGDDGVGMDTKTMHRCLQLGFSTRYNDRRGIGRFGVGMTLGSINQCKKIEVYSRMQGGSWHYAYLDLVAIEKAGDEAVIEEPVAQEPPKELQSLAGSTGTIVVWSDIDRMHEHDIQKLRHWIGRSYRKFLGELVLEDQKGAPPKPVKNEHRVYIEVNGERAVPFDPLYFFPYVKGDPPADLTESIVLDFPIDDDTLDTANVGTTAPVRIHLSLLPKELRAESGAGGSEAARQRHIPQNTGFSLLRNGREVYYGPWLGVLDLGEEQAGRQIDRYWGMEIEFDARLDTQFQVRNIKTGAKPLPALQEAIEKAVYPTILQFRKSIREYWTEAKVEEDKKKPEAATKHGKAETIARSIKPKSVQPTAEEKKELIEKLLPDIAKSSGEKGEKEVEDWLASIGEGYKIVESASAPAVAPFIDINPQAGKVLIIYTMKNRYFTHVYSVLEDIEKRAEAMGGEDAIRLAEGAQSLKDSLDLLLMAFASAYTDALSVDKEHAEPILERLMQQWSMTLTAWAKKVEKKE